MDVAGIVLYSILKNPDNVLEIWPKLKLQYFGSAYSEIFVAISNYYNKFDKLPSFQALEIITRDSSLNRKIKALSLLEIDEDIDIEIAIEALIDQYTQEEILDNLSSFVDKITHYDSTESISKLSEIVMHIEENIDHSDEIVLMNDIYMLDEEVLHSRIPFTLNNTLDANTGGIELTNLVMVGGFRGSGKTVTACNFAANHYSNGDVVLVFTIEMRAREINDRLMSILSGVSNNSIKRQICTKTELLKIAKTRSEFFTDSEEVYEDYLKHENFKKFEIDLIKSKKLKLDNQIILVDNATLTLPDIDLNIQRFKAKHGDKLRTVIVDHVNKIAVPDKYDWKQQIELSDKLKVFADKYGVLMMTPYQIDKTGEARFAKGLLDSADVGINLTAHEEYINFKSNKVRGMAPFDFNAPVEWDTLRVSPDDYIIPNEQDSEQEKVKELQ